MSYKIVRNIQGKYSDFDLVQKFMLTYRKCPICEGKNHDNYLINFYYNESESIRILRDYLIQNINSEDKIKQHKIKFGIPCCNCFTQFFGEEPNYTAINSLF